MVIIYTKERTIITNKNVEITGNYVFTKGYSIEINNIKKIVVDGDVIYSELNKKL